MEISVASVFALTFVCHRSHRETTTRFAGSGRRPYLSQEEGEVSDGVDGGDAEGVLHDDGEGVARRRAEVGVVDGGGGVGVLKETRESSNYLASIHNSRSIRDV